MKGLSCKKYPAENKLNMQAGYPNPLTTVKKGSRLSLPSPSPPQKPYRHKNPLHFPSQITSVWLKAFVSCQFIVFSCQICRSLRSSNRISYSAFNLTQFAQSLGWTWISCRGILISKWKASLCIGKRKMFPSSPSFNRHTTLALH